MTIDPPPGWICIVSLACCETDSAPIRLSSIILRFNFALDSAVKSTANLRRPRRPRRVAVPVDDRVDHRLDRVIVADVAGWNS